MAKKTITTSNNSGTVFTTSSGNVFSATSTNTAY